MLDTLRRVQILMGFYQIAIKIEKVYEVRLPPQVRALLQYLRFAVSLGIEVVPLACVGADGYIDRLQFWMWAPVVLAAGAAAIVVASLAYRGRLKADNWRHVVIDHLTPVFLRGAFLFYPIITNVMHRRARLLSAVLPL